jgi:hypothetical protein
MKDALKSLSISRNAAIMLAAFIGIATFAPYMKEQLVTGTIVNAMLFAGVALMGANEGLLIGLVPSSMALAIGLLSPAMAPMIPFIIVGNALLVLTFNFTRKINYWLGVLTGSLMKFGFLFLTSSIVAGFFASNATLAASVTTILTWPQLITAVSGGILAYGIVRLVKLVK